MLGKITLKAKQFNSYIKHQEYSNFEKKALQPVQWCGKEVRNAFQLVGNLSKVIKRIAKVALGAIFYVPSLGVGVSIVCINKSISYIFSKKNKEIKHADLSKFFSKETVSFAPQGDYPPIEKNQETRLERYRKITLTVQKKFTEAGIPNWIDGGTLLGVYRHGDKQLPQDYDCDICILDEDSKKASKILKQIAIEDPDSFEYTDLAESQPRRFMRLWVKRRWEKGRDARMGIETYQKNPKSGTLEMCYGNDTFENIFPLVKTNFYGEKDQVWVPKNTEAHLKTRYNDLSPIYYWNEEKKSLVLNLEHPLAEEEKTKVADGGIKAYVPATFEEHKKLFAS